MRRGRCHTALGRHARVPQGVRPADVLEGEIPGEPLGAAHLLVDLDRAPCAHHAQVGPMLTDPALGLLGTAADDDAGMARPHVRLARFTERLPEPGGDGPPALALDRANGA